MTNGETKVVREVLEELDKHPDVLAARTNAGVVKVRGGFMHLAPVGWADVTAGVRRLCDCGRPYFGFAGVECKSNHKPTCKCENCTAQREWGGRVQALGGLYIPDVRTVDEVLSALGKPLPVRQRELALP